MKMQNANCKFKIFKRSFSMVQRLCPLYLWYVCLQLFYAHSAEVPPSPAGGGWLELTQPGGYVFVEDHPDFDANIADEFTIQMWICFKRYPKFLEAWPLIHKQDTYLLIIYGFSPTLKGIERLPDKFAADLWYFLNFKVGGRALRPPWVPIKVWHHLMLIKKGNASALYLNGQRLNQPLDDVKDLGDTDSPVYLAGTAAPSIGVDLRGAEWKPFTGGLIDEVEIANTARYSPWNQEVTIPAGRLSPDEHTVALWHFDGPRKSAFADSSLQGNHPLIPFDVNTGPFAVEAAGKLPVTLGHLKAMSKKLSN